MAAASVRPHRPDTEMPLYARSNAFLEGKGVKMPKATSTGTTIVGCLFKDGIVLGADTRATAGPIVADKNCEKVPARPTTAQIHYISESIRCCGAGTARTPSFNIELHALSTGRKPRVVTAMTMLKQRLFQHQGQIGAALVLGGVDATGAHLFTIHPHGSTDNSHALQLVVAAISAGIFNDLGSGSNVDACVITASNTEMLRNYVTPNVRVEKERTYGFRRGTTAWTREKVHSLIVSEEVRPVAAEAMDTS
ncbi:nucleophile aminohydrolase [Gloeopeniophorella convolvens]|nr:nucleophile aminohydrolase [Gloeopeniophorella convolvens]